MYRYTFVPLTVALLGISSGFAEESRTDMTTDEIIVTATRFEENYPNQPVSVTIISSQEIRQSPARTVPELLSYHGGMASRDLYGNHGASVSVDLRGFGATAAQNTLVLVDGRRLSDIDISGVQWSAIPLDSIERIEIVRNGGAVLYGDGAVAGVINLITRKPGIKGHQGSVSAGAGDFGTRAASVAAETMNETMGLRAGGSYYDSDGYRKNNRNKESSVHAESRLDLGGDSLAIRISGARQSLRLPGERLVQPSIGQNELETDRRGTSKPKDYAARDDQILHLDYSRGSDAMHVVLGASYRRKEQESYFDFSGFPDYREVSLNVMSLTPRVRWDHSTSTLPGVLVAGLDWYVWDYDLALTASPATIGQPVHRVTAEQKNRAAYLLETINLGSNTTATAGIRQEWFSIHAQDIFDPAAPNPSFFPPGSSQGHQKDRQKALELGLRQTISDELSAYARVVRAFRFATVDEVYESSSAFDREFQFLRPQTSKTVELGADQRSGVNTWRASLFRSDINHEIHLDPFTSGIGNTNLPPSRRRGMEFELRTRPVPNTAVSLSYTYTKAKFLEGEFPGGPFTPTNIGIAGKTIPLVPRHRASFSANSSLSEQMRMSLVTSYVSDQYMENDEENSLGAKIPSYTITDLKIAYLMRRWSLELSVSNLFDRDYYHYGVRSQFVSDRYSTYPLPGRSAFLSAKFDLAN